MNEEFQIEKIVVVLNNDDEQSVMAALVMGAAHGVPFLAGRAPGNLNRGGGRDARRDPRCVPLRRAMEMAPCPLRDSKTCLALFYEFRTVIADH